MRIWVVSPGGTGCTYLINLLKKNGCVTNDFGDRDGVKHMNSPEHRKYKDMIKKFDKIVYVYNDPLLAIQSHYRRDWPFKQHTKISTQPISESSLGTTFEKWQENTMQKKMDIYGIQQHFQRWFNKTHEIPILFIDFRNENDFVKLSEFIGKKITKSEKKRKSNKESVRSEIVEMYDAIDADICEKIKDVDSLSKK